MSLLTLLFLVLISKQLTWSAAVPLWQFPDEQAHFAQVQNIVEKNQVKIIPSASTSREIYESEIFLGTDRDWAGNNKYTYHPEYNISYSTSTIGIHEQEILSFTAAHRSEQIINEATGYPPLYYLLLSLGYRLVYPFDLLTRVFFTRLINIFIFAVNIYVVSQISKIIFEKDKFFQLLLVIFVGFHPMYSFVFGGINSDNLYNLLFTVAIYLSLKLLQRDWKISTFLSMLASIFIAHWIKPQGILVVGLYLFPLSMTIRHTARRQLFPLIGGVILFLFGIGATIYKLFSNQQLISELPSVSYMPKVSILDYLQYLMETLKHTYKETLPWYWGIYRWLSLTYPRIIHRIVNWLILIGAIGVGKYLLTVRTYKSANNNLIYVLFLVYASIMYFLALSFFDYLFTRSHGFSFGIQGRYYFPVIVVHMALLLIGFQVLARRFKLKFFALKSLGLTMIALHTYTLFFLLESYYGNNLKTFFMRASQYKPIFYKTPAMEIIFFVSLGTLVIFLVYYLCYLPAHEKN